MLVSCGDSVQPATEADERACGPEDVLDAVQQPAPAAQRPGVGQMGDRLLHQRAPRLQAVMPALGVAEAVNGAAVLTLSLRVPAVACDTAGSRCGAWALGRPRVKIAVGWPGGWRWRCGSSACMGMSSRARTTTSCGATCRAHGRPAPRAGRQRDPRGHPRAGRAALAVGAEQPPVDRLHGAAPSSSRSRVRSRS